MLIFKTNQSLRWALFILLSLVTTVLCAKSSEQDQESRKTVIASIKPLQLIIKEITGNYLNVEVLLPANASPHFYHLRPSDLKKLTRADLLFWVGADMETFLPTVIDSLSLNNIALDELNNDTPPIKHKSVSFHDSRHHDHDHDDNPHLWIDPVFVAEKSEALLTTLVKLYPHLEETFTTNHQGFKNRLYELTEDYQARFSQIKKRDIYSEHDAFSPLAQHFGLEVRNFISQTPEKKPGAALRRVLDFNRKEAI